MSLFITSGGLRVDYLITHSGKPHIGLVGGNAVYAAVGAALWHEQIGLWARLGENYPQKFDYTQHKSSRNRFG